MTVDPPTTTNEAAEIVNKIISAANSQGAKLVEDLAIASQPWLGWPVINTLFTLLVGWFATKISIAEQTGATFFIIDTQIDIEKADLLKARNALLAAQKSGDKNAIAKAIQDYADAQSNLVHNNGSSTPR